MRRSSHRDSSPLTNREMKLNDQPATSVSFSEAELSAAFDFYDVRGQGRITANDLSNRLGAFYKNLPAKDIKMLLGEGPFTKDALRMLMSNNELGGYDPIKDAFKAYDPNGTGFMDPDVLRAIFKALGYGDVTDEDFAVLTETADVDRDGRISLEDFRQMMRSSGASEPSSPISRFQGV
mmetsp:Transcript_22382/g.55668  ORF Transcript_22382/g.55668 Transcript_22382/m.55668 type:complete len:179 (+) Transcript_22382:21-557(+)